MTITVRALLWAISVIRASIRAASDASRCSVGSSRIRTGAGDNRARATARRLISPPDRARPSSQVEHPEEYLPTPQAIALAINLDHLLQNQRFSSSHVPSS